MAVTIYSRASGNWNTGTTWSTVGCGGASCGCTPGAGDIVIICTGNTVTYNAGGAVNIGGAGNVSSITVQTGAELDATGHSLAVNSGGILNLSGTLIVVNVAIAAGASVTASFSSTFTILGNYANASNNVTLNGNTNISGNFANSGNSVVNGHITVGGNFANNGTAVISGDGCITVAGNYANPTGVVFGTTGGTTAPCNPNPLPITLTAFTANYAEETNFVLIDWTVATQINNKEFVIEKTTDGINYTDIATLPGAGTTSFPQSYSTIDNSPAAGISYYRLKQLDVDGNPTLFAPVLVSIADNDQRTGLTLYPNPVGSTTSLTYNSTDESPLYIDIIDLTGRKVSSLTLNNIKMGENTFSINTSFLNKGIYFLRATGAQKVYTIKIVR